MDLKRNPGPNLANYTQYRSLHLMYAEREKIGNDLLKSAAPYYIWLA